MSLWDVGDLERLSNEESQAVEAEDFETASKLSAESEALKSRLLRLQREVRAAEEDIQAVVRYQSLSDWYIVTRHCEFKAGVDVDSRLGVMAS